MDVKYEIIPLKRYDKELPPKDEIFTNANKNK